MAARPHHFLLLAALLLLIGASSSGAAGDVVAAGNGKVTVELYYESLCPPSALFVVDLLAEALEGLLEAADVTLVPYGNAKVRKDGTITCEHGPEERLLNTVENVHFGFINCVEGLVMNETQGEWESCFQKLGLYPKAVTECYKSEHGHKLSLKYGKQTGALVPPLTGVPWVVVDGKQRDDGEFVSYVCKAYKGRPPKICQEPDRHYPTVQQEQVVEPGNTVTYSSGDFKLDDGVEDEIEVPRADDN